MAAVYARVVFRQGFQEPKARTSQEEGLAPADQEINQRRGQAPLPDLFFSPDSFYSMVGNRRLQKTSTVLIKQIRTFSYYYSSLGPIIQVFDQAI